MSDAFICDAARTPIGRYGGALSTVRTDDLAAAPLKALVARNPGVGWAEVDDLIYGCANQAGEDNRNVESMSRAPFVMPKADTAFSRANAVYDTTIGWRFVNPRMKAAFGTDSMPETTDNVAAEFDVGREDQDAFAARSQARWAAAQEGVACSPRKSRP